MISTYSTNSLLANCTLAAGMRDFDTWMSSFKLKWNDTIKESHEAVDPQLPATLLSLRSAAEILDSIKSAKSLNVFQLESPVSPTSSSSTSSPPTTSKPTPASSPGSSYSFSSFTPSIPPFTTEFFEVRSSKKKGWGAFATRDIEGGTIIMKERPLLKTSAVTLFQDLEQLSLAQRAEYFALHGWTGVHGHVAQDTNRCMAIFMTNRFEITNAIGGIFLKSSRFNHACHEFRNCTYRYDSTEDCIIIKSLTYIRKGEEMTISYSPTPANLYENYGFYCDCPACPPPKIAKGLANRSRRTR